MNQSIKKAIPRNQKERNAPQERYPEGCPIEGHQGYGCTCNQVPIRS